MESNGNGKCARKLSAKSEIQIYTLILVLLMDGEWEVIRAYNTTGKHICSAKGYEGNASLIGVQCEVEGKEKLLMIVPQRPSKQMNTYWIHN